MPDKDVRKRMKSIYFILFNFSIMKRILLPVLLLSVLVSQVSCRRNRYRIDISGARVKLEVKRLEADLFGSDPQLLPQMTNDLQKKYGSFLQLFSYVINAGEVTDSSFTDVLVSFSTDKLNCEVYAETQKIFHDFGAYTASLEECFSHYSYYFPGKVIPDIYTCITGFNNSIITGDSVVGISLERYLGADNAYYPQLGIYKYVSDRMSPENIVPDVIYAWAASDWDYRAMGYPSDNVMASMMHYGKLKYFERCMLPGLSDELLFGYSADQLKFCRNNEGQMWQYLVEKDLLFSTDQFTVNKLTGEAPFTSFFTRESPGRAAVWLGFRIIEAYMQKNSDVSLEGLMNTTDVQMILEGAKYAPQ